MFALAMEAKKRDMGVVGSTQNILDFIAAKVKDAVERPFPDTLQVRGLCFGAALHRYDAGSEECLWFDVLPPPPGGQRRPAHALAFAFMGRRIYDHIMCLGAMHGQHRNMALSCCQ